MAPRHAHRVLVLACACALGALALMTWQLVEPRVVPVIVAMSVGQILGTASFASYLFVVVMDIRARRGVDKDVRAPQGVDKNVAHERE